MILMQRLLKIVYRTSNFLLSFWLLTAIFGTFITLEISNHHYEFIYDNIRFFGIPVAIILTLTGTIKQGDTTEKITTKVCMTIIIAMVVVFIMIMTLFAGMCDWTTDKVFFESKQSSATKIVQRSFGCGATDSSPATIRLFKVREFTPYLIWVTSVDTNQINKSEWTRIE